MSEAFICGVTLATPRLATLIVSTPCHHGLGCSGLDRYTQVMPIFEYVCRECRHQFELIVNGNSKVACPSCQSRRLEKQLSVFALNSKANATTNVVRDNLPMGPCGSCGDPRGPGSCSMN